VLYQLLWLILNWLIHRLIDWRSKCIVHVVYNRKNCNSISMQNRSLSMVVVLQNLYLVSRRQIFLVSFSQYLTLQYLTFTVFNFRHSNTIFQPCYRGNCADPTRWFWEAHWRIGTGGAAKTAWLQCVWTSKYWRCWICYMIMASK